ncbi:MAG TPA: PAS domain S-box protein [Bacteroidales bacterium]|nr:PAS domain S-box protein [Bacteroidales bacterium]
MNSIVKLFESQESFRLLFDLSYDPILIFKNFQFIDCNPATLTLLGYSSKDEFQEELETILSPEYQPDGERSLDKAKKMMKNAYERGYHRFEWMHLNKEGESLYLDVTLTKIPFHNKNFLFAIWRDISKQKEYENNLTKSEELYSLLFDQAADGILVGVGKGEIIDANKSICDLTGYNKHELIGNNINGLFTKNELKDNPLRYDLIKVGNTIIKERNIVCKDGRLIPVEMNTKILEDGRMQALFRDLSARKAAEKALVESEEKYRNVFNYAPLGILHYDQYGVITDCNQNLVNIIGSSKEQLVGLHMIEDLNNNELIKKVEQSLKEGKAVFEDWYTSVTGEKTTFVKGVFKCIYDENHHFISGIGLIEDITKRKKAELAMIESEQKYRLLFENASDAIMLMNEDVFIDCNEKTLELFGCSKKEIIGQTPYKFSPEKQPDGKKSKEKAREKIKEAIQDKPKIFEWVHQKADGKNFYTEVSLNIFDLHKKKTVQAIVRDISERKEFEQRIYETIIETEERERQRLASDIHDEIGPLLSSLKVYIESLNPKGEEAKQIYIKTKLQELIKETVDNVREVSNAISPYILNKYGLEAAIKSFIQKTENVISIRFKSNVKDKRFPLKTEIVYFRIIKELLNNTLKHARAKNIDVNLQYSNGELQLCYKDDGIGLDKKHLSSAKAQGMGLFNIINRVNSIQGDYKFYENFNGFKFTLMAKAEKEEDKKS